MNLDNIQLKGILEVDDKPVKVYDYKGTINDRRKSNLKTFMSFVDVKNRILVLFPEFYDLTSNSKEAILYHEIAHLKGILDEAEADKYSIRHVSLHYFKKCIKECEIIHKRINPQYVEREERLQFM